jgi:uncharacterized protein (TIGR03435 family)
MIRKALAVGLLGVGMAMAQAPSVPASAKVPAAPAAAPARPLTFDVVSIRQNMSPAGPQGMPQVGPTPDGYHMINFPMAYALISAYVPEAGGGVFMPNDLTGLPPWAMQDRYDIVAKVSEEDLPEWQKPSKQPAMLQAMLQALLVERCKIAVHRSSKDASVYLLVVGKNGPKFKPTDPSAPHPAGMSLPGGAVMVPSGNGAMTLYGTSMGLVATILSQMGNLGRPVQDKTGLTGLYDISIKPEMEAPAGGGPPDRSEMVFSAVDSLGLKLDSGKAPVETLVIDHMDKPSVD